MRLCSTFGGKTEEFRIGCEVEGTEIILKVLWKRVLIGRGCLAFGKMRKSFKDDQVSTQ
jgi:hypothetical protein